MQPIDAFPIKENGLVIRQHVEAGKPFTVAGARGALLGQQEGTLEAWMLPVKLLSHLAIRADVEGYAVPIALERFSASYRAVKGSLNHAVASLGVLDGSSWATA